MMKTIEEKIVWWKEKARELHKCSLECFGESDCELAITCMSYCIITELESLQKELEGYFDDTKKAHYTMKAHAEKIGKKEVAKGYGFRADEICCIKDDLIGKGFE